MSAKIRRAGVIVQAGDFTAETRGKLMRRFTVTHKEFKGYKSMTAYFYDRSSGNMILARAQGVHFAKRAGMTLENCISPGLEIPACEMLGRLANDQQLIRDRLLANYYNRDRVRAGEGYAYIKRRAGRGKTYIALSLVPVFGGRTLYVVHNLELLDQTTSKVRELFPSLRVGRVGGGYCDTGDIIIANVSSIIGPTVAGIPCRDWYEQFRYIIIDEVPKYCTAASSKLFMKTQAPYVLAMSGTPEDRLDGMWRVAYMHYGTPIDMDAVIDTIMPSAAISWRVEARQLAYTGPPEYTRRILSDEGTVSHPLIVNMLSTDPARTSVIVGEAVRMVREGGTVFVMVDRREFAALIVRLARAQLGDAAVETPDADVQIMLGGTATEQKIMAKNESRICVMIYAFAVGLSYPRYDSIIFAHPRRNGFEQFISRALRLDGDVRKVRRFTYIRDIATSLKGQYSGFKTNIEMLFPGTHIERYQVDVGDVALLPEAKTGCDAIAAKIEK